jgi:hypothetical protein
MKIVFTFEVLWIYIVSNLKFIDLLYFITHANTQAWIVLTKCYILIFDN